jgi:molecular chaperone DnaK
LANTTIPYSTQRRYSLQHADQAEVEVRVYQDHTGKARFPSDAVDTGIFGLIDDIPPAEDGIPHPIEVEFSYNNSGMIKLLARLPTTGQRAELTFESSPMRMNDSEMLASKQRVQDLWEPNPKVKRYTALVQKAQRLAETADASGKRRLNAAVSDLQGALDADSEDGIKEAGDRLTDLLFDLENDMPG